MLTFSASLISAGGYGPFCFIVFSVGSLAVIGSPLTFLASLPYLKKQYDRSKENDQKSIKDLQAQIKNEIDEMQKSLNPKIEKVENIVLKLIQGKISLYTKAITNVFDGKAFSKTAWDALLKTDEGKIAVGLEKDEEKKAFWFSRVKSLILTRKNLVSVQDSAFAVHQKFKEWTAKLSDLSETLTA